MYTDRLKKPITTLATIAYAVVVVGGYGLHGLVGLGVHDHCDDTTQSSGAVGSQVLDLSALASDSACCCSEHRSVAESIGPAIQDCSNCHDPHACSICAVLAQVKVGYQALSTNELLVKVVAQQPLSDCSRIADELILTADARGPPALGA